MRLGGLPSYLESLRVAKACSSGTAVHTAEHRLSLAFGFANDASSSEQLAAASQEARTQSMAKKPVALSHYRVGFVAT